MKHRFIHASEQNRSFMRFLLFSSITLLLAPLALALPKVSDPALQQCIDDLVAKHQWSTVSDVTSIKCHKKRIKSAKGLEQFTALSSLSLFNNQLREFESSAYPNLSSLNLARNQLSSLTIAKLGKLQKLYVFDNNITDLALSKLPQLTMLKANSNAMKTLSYSALPALEKIYIFDNALETIDIYNLPAMRYMDCRENPMPDSLYDEMDVIESATILHDGNADDW